jgi:hypothetical protein
MGGEVSPGCDQDVTTRLAIAHSPILGHARLEYLVNVDSSVHAQH